MMLNKLKEQESFLREDSLSLGDLSDIRGRMYGSNHNYRGINQEDFV